MTDSALEVPMESRWMLAAAAAAWCALSVDGIAAAQDPPDVAIETIAVGQGVHMLVGSGGNIAVFSGPDGVLIVDDQFAPLTEKIRAAVGRISDRPIRFVLNTHWHGDHTGGNENFGKAGAVIVAHDNVRQRMSVEQFNAFSGKSVPASPEKALPVVTFNDSVTFHLNGEEIHAFHVGPAHTDGDSFIRFRRANVVHLGDIYFNGTYPFIDIASGGSIDGMIDAVGKALELADAATRVIPGHGPLSKREELAAYGAMLSAVRERVAALLAAGKSADEVVAAWPTAEFDEKWGRGFMKPDPFVTTVHDSLARSAVRR